MGDSPRKGYSRSPSPWEEKSRSRSPSPTRSHSRPRGRSRSRSHGRDEDSNPGDTLYVTGLSSRVTQRDLEEHFSKEGKVKSAFLVVEPRTRISRGFAFVTMDSPEDANRCIKHLNQSVLEGRYITVEKSRRKRPRTPTPGHYLGLHQSLRGDSYRSDRGRYRGRDDYGYRRSPRRSPYRGGRDYGTFMSSPSFNGGYKVCGFLGVTDPKHTTLKGLFLSTLTRLHDKFIPVFTTSTTQMFTNLEKELSEKGTSYFNPLSDNLSFEFLFKLFCEGKNPADTSVGTNGPKIVDKWVFLQLAPLISLGLKFVPNFLEDLVLHTFPLPYFLVKRDHQKLYNAFYNSMGSILDEAEKLGLKRDEACHNFVFLAGFNSYGGMKVFFPSLIKWIGTAGPSLHTRLAKEIRSAVKEAGGVTLSALEKMALVKSVVYETLRMDPPVPFQTVKARKNIIVSNHDSSFLIKKDELIFGYQPLAMKDSRVFKNAEEFDPDRFVGVGEKLLKYVYWSNGKETHEPTVNDKQCPGKDLIVLLGRLMVVELFMRYDTFEIEYGKLLLGSKVTFKSITKATS